MLYFLYSRRSFYPLFTLRTIFFFFLLLIVGLLLLFGTSLASELLVVCELPSPMAWPPRIKVDLEAALIGLLLVLMPLLSMSPRALDPFIKWVVPSPNSSLFAPSSWWSVVFRIRLCAEVPSTATGEFPAVDKAVSLRNSSPLQQQLIFWDTMAIVDRAIIVAIVDRAIEKKTPFSMPFSSSV